ncbi:N-acetylneuraminate synthase family protein [Alphaproteobacteria bacterium]|nr:N-acetylneuraminate synthase family protein [Alphaproteobacteria bacterium]
MQILEYKKKGRTYVIAEIGQAHDGSLGILHSLIEVAANIGVDAVKFQMHIAEAESSISEPFRLNFSYEDQTRYDYWKRMEFSKKEWEFIKKKCDDLGVEFLVTPFSNTAIDWLENIGVEKYKVGSGDASNLLLLEKIASTKKEVIISSGLATLDEIDQSILIFKRNNIPYTIMQCTTKYPTPPNDVGLGWIKKFKERYNCPVGFSDHSGTIFSGLGAITLGAEVIEAHITFDKKMFGPDSKASLTVNEFKKMIEGIRFIEMARGEGTKKDLTSEKKELRRIFGRAIAVNKKLSPGHIITIDDLEVKKPADCGIPVNDFKKIIGKKLINHKNKWEFLDFNDFNDFI